MKPYFFIIIFILIPAYIFWNSIHQYLNQFEQITYSLNMPDNKTKMINDYEDNLQIKNTIITKETLTEKEIIESWIVTYPINSANEGYSNFLLQLKSIGVTTIVLNKKSSNTNISIGPFVDKSVASTLALRIKELTKRDGKIKRLNN